MMAAVSAAASTLPNPPQAESELLRQLKQQEALADAQKTGDVTNIGYITFMERKKKLKTSGGKCEPEVQNVTT